MAEANERQRSGIGSRSARREDAADDDGHAMSSLPRGGSGSGSSSRSGWLRVLSKTYKSISGSDLRRVRTYAADSDPLSAERVAESFTVFRGGLGSVSSAARPRSRLGGLPPGMVQRDGSALAPPPGMDALRLNSSGPSMLLPLSRLVRVCLRLSGPARGQHPPAVPFGCPCWPHVCSLNAISSCR